MQGRTAEPNDPSAPRWTAAVALALLWHVAWALLLQLGDPFAPREPRSTAAPARTPVELTFRAEPLAPREALADDERPRNFTELPPDRADTAPERADALSNVDSRARDRAEDDTRADLPRMEGRGESPSVAMDASPPATETPAAAGIDAPPVPDGVSDLPAEDRAAEDTKPATEPRTVAQQAPGTVAEIGDQQRLERPGVEVTSGDGQPPPRVGDPLRSGERAGRSMPETQPRFLIGSGIDDVHQEEMDHRAGNVPLFGDLSLNTVAWEYAPWLQRFTREFHRNWLPPYAYFALGVIKGHQVVHLEIAPDGTLLSLEVQEDVGHESLRESTVGNFRSLAPYHPLPKGFPEPTLQLTIKVIYPGRR